MSTRATYLIKSRDEWRSDVCLYIHHDGYEAGAAYYLYNAFQAGGNITAESMIRGNERAEITGSHETHGDTEYRYTIDGNELTVEAIQTVCGDDWRTIYRGDWVAFVNQHISADWVADFQPLKRIKVGYCESVFTPETAQAMLAARLQQLGQWTIGAYKDSPNAANMVSLRKDIEQLQNSLATFYHKPKWSEAA